jgi:hypothetical protein
LNDGQWVHGMLKYTSLSQPQEVWRFDELIPGDLRDI